MEPTNEVMSVEEQLAAMREGVQYHFPVKIRGFNCILRPLSIDEMNEVITEVRAQIRTSTEDTQHTLKENTIKATETLWRASMSGPNRNDAKIHKKLLGMMTNDELMTLHKEYIRVCDNVNPMLDKMPAEDMERIIEHLKKKENEQEVRLALTELSISDVVNILGKLLTTGD